MSEAILRAEGLEKWYSTGRAGRVGLRRPTQVEAVGGVDLEIRAGETLALAFVLLAGSGTAIRLLVGLPLLAHLGYTAMTALPMGMVPGRPEGSKQERRNQDLRSWVVRFLNEVRELEEYMWRARTSDWTADEVEEKLRLGRQRVMAAATEVSKAVGQSSGGRGDGDETEERAGVSILTHAKPVQPSSMG